MAYRRLSSGHPALRSVRPASGRRARSGGLAALVGIAALVAIPGGLPSRPGEQAVPAPIREALSSGQVRWMLDPTPTRGAETFVFGSAAPAGSLSRSLFAQLDTKSREPAAVSDQVDRPAPSEPMQFAQATPDVAPVASPIASAASLIIPLPAARPSDLRADEPSRRRVAGASLSRRMRVAARPPTTEDNRSFFEKLFGTPAAPGTPSTPAPALAYAALGAGTLETAPSRRLSPSPFPSAGAGVAIYDISARTVTLPNGERLEAHSGLGDKIDDPRHVHVRMRGATPPGTYDLTEREQLFHGVRAIRLNPVGGAGAIFGRTGLLAHTFMLGANGDSNGCVSFRDYGRFLQAFVRGEVTRLVVVAGRKGDAWPNFASTGGPAAHADRPARGA